MQTPDEPEQTPSPVVKKYTLKTEKNIDNWLFHPDYFTESTRNLPMSQQNILKNRLVNSKIHNVPESDLKTLNPVIEQKLKCITVAYLNKQERARNYSKMMRSKAKNLAEEKVVEIKGQVKSEECEYETLEDLLNSIY